MKRRTFFGAVGATLVLPKTAFAKKSSRLKIGIIGVGMRGQVHLANLLLRDDVAVSAICDIDPFMIDKALDKCAKAGARKPQVYTGSPDAWREMLAKARLDAVKARGLNKYIRQTAPDHPNRKTHFKLGDVVQTQIACANGETILLSHDTSLPRPYSLGFRVQGDGGIWMDVNESIYIEQMAKVEDEWEPAQPWLDKYDHPLWQAHGAKAEGAGHGGMDFFVLHAWVEALKRGAPMPIDIYDALSWSAITPMSELSLANANKTVEFPDFTAGQWRNRKPIFALDGRY
jgi:hypothetical protein